MPDRLPDPTTDPDQARLHPGAGRDRRAGPLVVARAVLWSFLGIRRSRDFEHDRVMITPVQVILGGVVGAVILVAGLLLLARWLVASAG